MKGRSPTPALPEGEGENEEEKPHPGPPRRRGGKKRGK